MRKAVLYHHVSTSGWGCDSASPGRTVRNASQPSRPPPPPLPGRFAGPPAERAIEAALVAEAEKEGDLGDGDFGVAQILLRELIPYFVGNLSECRPGLDQFSLESSHADVKRTGDVGDRPARGHGRRERLLHLRSETGARVWQPLGEDPGVLLEEPRERLVPAVRARCPLLVAENQPVGRGTELDRAWNTSP
jgi:hypothetical protein